MTDTLIAIAIGPVQDFIAAGRRTRDLWYGSKLLSEASRQAAWAVHDCGGQLIFPGSMALSRTGPDEERPGIANVILARLRPQLAPEKAACKAREAARRYWEGAAQTAFERAKDLVREEIWKEQLDGVIEVYAAWAPLETGKYAASRRTVMRLLAGRKLVRDFDVWTGHAGVPKSSLDGARESVFKDIPDRERGIAERTRRQLRLSPGEHLDIVGLTKRVRQPKGFPSVTRIAADTWLRNLPKADLAALNEVCLKLAGEEKLIELIKVPDDVFPWEGSAVYRSRHHELVRENADSEADSRDLPPAYEPLSRLIERLEHEYGIPDPYVACLAADGDKMGAALDAINDPDIHRQFSDRLAEFAGEVQAIVQDHYGSLVYSGGDDVLAFVPVKLCIKCADTLRRRFRELVVDKFAPEASLSVGIAIVHAMEHMEDIRKFANEAEKDAKDGDKRTPEEEKRNAIAVHVHPRGGSPTRVRGRWGEGLADRLKQWTDAYLSDSLSSKSAYDLKRLLTDYRVAGTERRWDDAHFQAAFPADAARVLHHKGSSKETAGKIRDLLAGVPNWEAAEAVINELIVARRLAIAVRQPSKLKGGPNVLPLEG